MKKTAHCECCGKKEGFGKCHERITFNNDTFYLCVDCSQIIYKIKDAVSDKNLSLANELATKFISLAKSPSELMKNWFDEYKTRIGFTVRSLEKSPIRLFDSMDWILLQSILPLFHRLILSNTLP